MRQNDCDGSWLCYKEKVQSNFFFLHNFLCADMKLISNSNIRPKFAPHARGDKLNLQNHVRSWIQATAPASRPVHNRNSRCNEYLDPN